MKLDRYVKTTVLVLLLSVIPPVLAQVKITGRVLDKYGKTPVESATVTAHPIHSKKILSYSMTDENGLFSLICDSKVDSVKITIRAMNLKTLSRNIKNTSQFIEFLSKEKKTELKEVIIQAPKVRQQRDTILYNVSSFTDKTDRSIGDVLKKMPGIQVLSSGQILYQNKAISNFYIEGLDLLKGKYNLATQNIDAQNVASVQVLENHQPIKALKGMEVPEAAAINLKLNQSALGAFFVTAQAGVGESPLIISNELIGMRFARKQQNMAIYKGDNSGRDIAKELVSFYGERGGYMSPYLHVATPNSPNIDHQHFLFNDAHFGSVNDSRVINKKYTLTSNISCLFDKKKQNGSTRRDIFLEGGDDILIEEDLSSRYLKRELEGSVTLEENTNDYFLKNQSSVSVKWNKNSGNVFSGDSIIQNLSLPFFHMGNEFEYLRHKGKRRFRIQSNISYSKQENDLFVTPSLFTSLLDGKTDQSMLQNVAHNCFATNTSISESFEGRFSSWYLANIYTNHNKIQSSLYGRGLEVPFSADSLNNDLTRSELGLRFMPGMQVAITENFKPKMDFPITYLRVQKEDHIRGNYTKKGYWLIAPNIYSNYYVSNKILLVAGGSYAKNIGGLGEDLLGYMMTSYRQLNRYRGLQSKTSSVNAFAKLKYKNPFTTLFVTLGLHWNKSWRNMLYDIKYKGVLSNTTSILYPHSSKNHGANVSIGKSISAINSDAKVNLVYGKHSSIVLNQGQISPYSSKNYSLGANITTSIGSWMIMKYGCTYLQNKSIIANRRLKAMHLFSQNMATSFIPFKRLIFSIRFKHYFNDAIESSVRSSWFGNICLKYKLKNVDLMLDWTNILNTQNFITSSYSETNRYYSEYKLRPAEVMLRVKFKIL